MKIYGIDKLSLVDFDDKVACTLFTAACNFRCGFCHNSSLVLTIPENEISEEFIFKYLKTRQGVIDAVVITGGEPTLQKDLKEFIKKIRELGYLIKLDTNGYNPDILIDLVNEGLLDYVAVDIKGTKEDYGTIVGLPNIDITRIEKTVDFLLENHVDYEFRTTLMEEFHNEEKIRKIGEWIKGAKRYRLQKYIDSENCIKGGYHEVKESDATKLCDIAKEFVLDTKLRSY